MFEYMGIRGKEKDYAERKKFLQDFLNIILMLFLCPVNNAGYLLSHISCLRRLSDPQFFPKIITISLTQCNALQLCFQ